MAINEIDQVIIIGRASSVHWEDGMIVPMNKMIYNTDTNIIKIGNGEDFLEDLPVHLDLNNVLNYYAFFTDKFPELSSADINKLVAAGTNEKLRTSKDEELSINDIATKNNMNSTLSTYADLEHTHNVTDVNGLGSAARKSIGLNYGEVPVVGADGMLPKTIIPPNYTLEDKDSDVISYLITAYASRSLKDISMPRGIVDEFADIYGVDTNLSSGYTYTQDALLTKDDTFDVISRPHEVDYIGENCYVFIRNKIISGQMNKDISVEVSRDDGDSFSPVILEYIGMRSSSIDCYRGLVNFSHERVTEHVARANEFILEDIKGSASTFMVSGDGIGYFDSPVSESVDIGHTIVIGDTTLTIASIVGDGTNADSVMFDGNISTGVYDNIKITGCYVNDSGKLTISNYYNSDTSEYNLVDGYYTSILEFPEQDWQHIYSMIEGADAPVNYNVNWVFGYDDDTFYVYNTILGVRIKIVRKRDGQWEYYDSTSSTWLASPKNDKHTAISTAISTNEHTHTHLDELSNVEYNIEGKKLNQLAITMSKDTDIVTDEKGLSYVTIDGINDTHSVTSGNTLRWRVKLYNDSNIELHGIRLRA